MNCFLYTVVGGLAVALLFAMLHQVLVRLLWRRLVLKSSWSFWAHGVATPIIFLAMGYPLYYLRRSLDDLGCDGAYVGVVFGIGLLVYVIYFFSKTPRAKN